MSVTTIKAVELLNNDFGNYATPSVNYYVGLGLASTVPDANESYAEVPTTVGGQSSNYSRVAVVRSASGSTPRWANATTGAPYAYNDGAIQFNRSLQDWGKIGYILLFNAESGGNLVYWGALGTEKTIESNTTVIFDSTKIQISME